MNAQGNMKKRNNSGNANRMYLQQVQYPVHYRTRSCMILLPKVIVLQLALDSALIEIGLNTLTIRISIRNKTLAICSPRNATQTNTRSPSSFQLIFSKMVTCDYQIKLVPWMLGSHYSRLEYTHFWFHGILLRTTSGAARKRLIFHLTSTSPWNNGKCMETELRRKMHTQKYIRSQIQ